MKGPFLAIVTLCVLGMTGCSSGPKPNPGTEKGAAAKGPVVLDARAKPSMIELDQNLKPVGTSEILAEVKDSGARVTSVSLRFADFPLEVPMVHISGTTWHATLNQDQLKLLAVSGKTIKYEVQVVANDAVGGTGTTHEPMEIAVRAPVSTKTRPLQPSEERSG